MAPDELGLDGREALEEALGHQAELDVAMIGGELAADGDAVSVRLAVERLVAVAAPDGTHICHPKVIGPGAEGVEGLLEGELDLEAQRLQPDDLGGREREVRAQQQDPPAGGMHDGDDPHAAAGGPPQQVARGPPQRDTLLAIGRAGHGL